MWRGTGVVVGVSDLSLEDLASGGKKAKDAAAAAEAATETTAESGESFTELLEFMDEKVGLERLMFGINNDTTTTESTTTEISANDEGDVPLSAETIAAFGEQIQAQYGDVPISKIVMIAQSKPDAVDDAIADLAPDNDDD